MLLENELMQISCPRCGGELEEINEGFTCGGTCKNCDWSVVSTYIPEVLADTTQFEIRLMNGNHRDLRHLKAVAYFTGVNFLEARQLLQGPPGFAVCSGRASEILKVVEKLNLAGLNYEIVPPFPYPVPSAVATGESGLKKDE